MTPNEQLIHTFYSAFQQRNYSVMQACYADHASFNDPDFHDLNAAQVRSMWEMFLVKNKTLIVEYGNVQLKDEFVTAEWTANYPELFTNIYIYIYIYNVKCLIN